MTLSLAIIAIIMVASGIVHVCMIVGMEVLMDPLTAMATAIHIAMDTVTDMAIHIIIMDGITTIGEATTTLTKKLNAYMEHAMVAQLSEVLPVIKNN